MIYMFRTGFLKIENIRLDHHLSCVRHNIHRSIITALQTWFYVMTCMISCEITSWILYRFNSIMVHSWFMRITDSKRKRNKWCKPLLSTEEKRRMKDQNQDSNRNNPTPLNQQLPTSKHHLSTTNSGPYQSLWTASF